jgi:hypothetical protein
MPWTLPTSSHFWPDWLTFGGRFHNISLGLASLTSYQPMVEFLGHSDHFIFSTRSCFWSNPPTFGGGFHKPSSDLTSLTFYQPMVPFQVILTTCFGRPPMCVMSAHTHPFQFLMHSLILHHKLSDAHFQ